MHRLRVAQVSPLFESVPPRFYGGTERVVHFLTEELVRQGHDVTLFASGDSLTSAKLVASWKKALRLDSTVVDSVIPHIVQLEDVIERLADFDIVHFHTSCLHFNVGRVLGIPQLNTMHGRLNCPELPTLMRRFSEIPLVSISDHQRSPLPECRWLATVHHGLPVNLFSYQERPDNYVAFLGRISPEKRVDRAIEISRRAGFKLKIAAKIDAADRAYYERDISSIITEPHVDYVGEINELEKKAFLGQARALLFPIDWPEPFGLVMIEAMACGTPVIAFKNGSVPEIIKDGENGFVVETIEEAVEKLKVIDTISRQRCRDLFEERFTSARMASDYIQVYSKLIAARARSRENLRMPQLSAPSRRGLEAEWKR